MLDFNLPYFTDEQRSLGMLMKEFCEREVDMKTLNDRADQPIPPKATPAELRSRLPFDLMSKAHDAGLRQIVVPTEYGGGGYEDDYIAQGMMAEIAGYQGGEFARLMTVPWKHIISLTFAPKEIASEVISDFMTDRTTMLAASITEPNSGSDMLVPYDEPGVAGQMLAKKDGDNWILNGDKMFCTAGGVSNYVLVTVRTDPKGPISKSVTQFAVPTKTKGWSINRVNDMMGNELVSNVQMHFENVVIPDKNRLTPVNGTYEHVKSRLAAKAIHLFGHLGWAERMWEDMKEYAKTRIQGGKPIIQHPNVGMLIAETDTLLYTWKLLQYQDAWATMGKGAEKQVLGWYRINWFGKKVLERVIQVGLEVYAGIGVQKELTFEHFVRVSQSMFHGGSTGILSLVKAASIIEKG
jgi:alkylation response protein AidB-like acyl-CoA dehydrogenase